MGVRQFIQFISVQRAVERMISLVGCLEASHCSCEISGGIILNGLEVRGGIGRIGKHAGPWSSVEKPLALSFGLNYPLIDTDSKLARCTREHIQLFSRSVEISRQRQQFEIKNTRSRIAWLCLDFSGYARNCVREPAGL